MFKHILVPTDGSELSNEAVERAVSFAKKTGARITFFYAQPEFISPFATEGALILLADPNLPERYAEAALAEADFILHRANKLASAAGVAADTDTIVSELPHKAIVDAATRHGCDLIFMASHGRGGIAGLLLGSQTQKVLVNSKIPVLVNR